MAAHKRWKLYNQMKPSTKVSTTLMGCATQTAPRETAKAGHQRGPRSYPHGVAKLYVALRWRKGTDLGQDCTVGAVPSEQLDAQDLLMNRHTRGSEVTVLSAESHIWPRQSSQRYAKTNLLEIVPTATSTCKTCRCRH